MVTLNKLFSKIIFYRNFWKLGTGLMFSRKIFDEAHVFVLKKMRRISITMMFVFFPIDVVFLDASKKVVDMKKNLKPFSSYTSNKKVHFFIEMSSGKIKEKGFKEGQYINF